MSNDLTCFWWNVSCWWRCWWLYYGKYLTLTHKIDSFMFHEFRKLFVIACIPGFIFRVLLPYWWTCIILFMKTHASYPIWPLCKDFGRILTFFACFTFLFLCFHLGAFSQVLYLNLYLNFDFVWQCSVGHRYISCATLKGIFVQNYFIFDQKNYQ